MPVTNFPPDLLIIANTSTAQANRPRFYSRLTTNGDKYLTSSSSIAETTETTLDNPRFTNNVSYATTASGSASGTYVGYAFKRAPGFMDVVCYSGNGTTNRAIAHNLGAVPEFMIARRREAADQWYTYHVTTGSSTFNPLNGNAAASTWSGSSAVWGTTAHTSTTFTVGTDSGINSATGLAYVVYLFATLAGISKVGSYTGNGGSQTINCGFTTGARFLLIKCTSATGDWYVWDSARGIVGANDPHLSLNTNAAHVTTDDSIDPDNSGFIVNQVAATNINVSSATYIFLAIA